MKRKLLSIFCLAGMQALLAQAPATQWAKTYGGSDSDAPRAITATAGGGYIMAGGAYSANGDVTMHYGSSDFWIVKTDSSGSIQWQKTFGTTEFEQANSVIATTDGGYLVGGFKDMGNPGDDAFLVKLDENGNLVWQKTFGGTGLDQIYSLLNTADGGYIVAAITTSADGDITDPAQGMDIWFLKLDASGNITWQKTYGGTGDENAPAMKSTADGGYIISALSTSADGDLTGNHGANDAWLFKTDESGNITWQANYGGSGNDSAVAVDIAVNGGYYIVGYSESDNGDVSGNQGNNDYWIVKVSDTGTIIWQKSYGGSDMDGASAVIATATGCIVSGTTMSNDGNVTGNHGTFDYWVLKLNTDGTIAWQKTYGGSNLDSVTAMCAAADGGIALAGLATSTDGDVTNQHGGGDYWLVKLAPENLGIDDVSLSAFSAYPNPVKDVLTIEGSSTIHSVKITDVTGKTVYNNTTGLNSTATVNVSNLQQGMYLLTVEAGRQTKTLKFIKE